MKTKIIITATVSLLMGLLSTTPASAYQSKEKGANMSAPGYVTEGRFGSGGLGTIEQSKPPSFKPDSVYGIDGQWPTYTPKLARGKGRQQVETYCSICHNTTYIGMQPPLAAKSWDGLVHKMLNTLGAKKYIPAKEVPVIIHYLQTHYTPETIRNNRY